MARRDVQIEEFHVGVYVARGLRAGAETAIRRALDQPRLRLDLRQAVRAVLGRRRALAGVRVTLTR